MLDSLVAQLDGQSFTFSSLNTLTIFSSFLNSLLALSGILFNLIFLELLTCGSLFLLVYFFVKCVPVHFLLALANWICFFFLQYVKPNIFFKSITDLFSLNLDFQFALHYLGFIICFCLQLFRSTLHHLFIWFLFGIILHYFFVFFTCFLFKVLFIGDFFWPSDIFSILLFTSDFQNFLKSFPLWMCCISYEPKICWMKMCYNLNMCRNNSSYTTNNWYLIRSKQPVKCNQAAKIDDKR